MYRICLRLVWAAILVAVPATSSSHAQERTTELGEILQEVIRANPTLRAAHLNAEALGFRPEQAAALPDPTVGITYQPFPILTARGSQRTQLRVEQTIPYPGKRALEADIASLTAETAFGEAQTLAQDLILQVKEAYFELYRVQELTAIVRGFQDELRGFEESAVVRYEVGQGMQQAILQAQLEKNQLSQKLIDLQARRRSAAETLARLTNDARGARHFQATELAAPPLPDVPIEALLDVSLAERPELAVLESEAARAYKEVELARKQFLPDLALHLTYFDIADAEMPPTASGRDALGVGASLKLPLQRSRVRARIAEAEVRRLEIDARREAIETGIETEIQDLLYTLEQERNLLTLYDQTLLPQAASTVEAALSAYTSGRSDFLNLLDAERTIYTLRTGRQDALTRYLKAAAYLERALGVISLTDLDAHVATQRLDQE